MRVKARGGVTSGALCRDAVICLVDFWLHARNRVGVDFVPGVLSIAHNDCPNGFQAGRSVPKLASSHQIASISRFLDNPAVEEMHCPVGRARESIVVSHHTNGSSTTMQVG